MRGLPSVSTPINIQQLATYLEHHPDQEFVHYLLTGLKEGFFTGIHHLPRNSLECRNLLSARTQPNITQELIHKELQKGFLAGPFEHPPFEIYRINPIGIAEGKYSKKKRLIVDLSSPHDDPHHASLNELINKEEFSLQYVTIDHAIVGIKQRGAGSWMCKTDISDAFKLVPIHPSLWPYHGIKWDNKYYFYTRLVFGSRSSPKIFDNLSVAICWIAEHHFRINCIFHLLDDFLTIDPPSFTAERTMAILSLLFKSLGIPTAPHKTIGPTQTIEYLGIILDTSNMRALLPDEKKTRICAILDLFAKKKSCTKRELLSLLGHLNFASRVIHPGRSFVSYLISLSTSVKELHHHVKLSPSCRRDIFMWHKFLSKWNGISFFLDDNITFAADMHLFTDATDKAFGGYFNGQWFQGHFPSAILQQQCSMAFLELYPIVMACVLWGHTWSQKRILFHCDNQATVEIISKGRSKVDYIMPLMRQITWCAANHNFTVHAKHIPGVDNGIADSISRFQMGRFRQLAPQAHTEPVPCLQMSQLMMF